MLTALLEKRGINLRRNFLPRSRVKRETSRFRAYAR